MDPQECDGGGGREIGASHVLRARRRRKEWSHRPGFRAPAFHVLWVRWGSSKRQQLAEAASKGWPPSRIGLPHDPAPAHALAIVAGDAGQHVCTERRG